MPDDKIQPLTGKPFFDSIVSRDHIKPTYNLLLPAKTYGVLPSKDIDTVLMCKGMEWKMEFQGKRAKMKRFSPAWKHFVDDNDLKVGDACIFELMECTTDQLKFRVHILRGDLTPSLQAKLSSPGDKNADPSLAVD